MRSRLIAAAVGSAITVIVIGTVAVLAYRDYERQDMLARGIW